MAFLPLPPSKMEPLYQQLQDWLSKQGVQNTSVVDTLKFLSGEPGDFVYDLGVNPMLIHGGKLTGLVEKQMFNKLWDTAGEPHAGYKWGGGEFSEWLQKLDPTLRSEIAPGEGLSMYEGMWPRSMQSLLPESTPQELRVFAHHPERDIPSAAYRHSKPHFPIGEGGVGHARSVHFRTGQRDMRTIKLWEEVQQEMKGEKGWAPRARASYTPSETARARGQELGLMGNVTLYDGLRWHPYLGEYADAVNQRTLFPPHRFQRSYWPQFEGGLDAITRDSIDLPGPIKEVVDNLYASYLTEAATDDLYSAIGRANAWVRRTLPGKDAELINSYIGSVLFKFQSDRLAGGSIAQRFDDLVEEMTRVGKAIETASAGAKEAAKQTVPKLDPTLGSKYVNKEMIAMLMREAEMKGEPFILSDVGGVFARGGGAVERGAAAPGIKEAYANLPKSMGLRRDVLEYVIPSRQLERGPSAHSLDISELFNEQEQMARGYELTARAKEMFGGGVQVDELPGGKGVRVAIPVWTDERSVDLLKKYKLWSKSQSEFAGSKPIDWTEGSVGLAEWKRRTKPYSWSSDVDEMINKVSQLYAKGERIPQDLGYELAEAINQNWITPKYTLTDIKDWVRYAKENPSIGGYLKRAGITPREAHEELRYYLDQRLQDPRRLLNEMMRGRELRGGR